MNTPEEKTSIAVTCNLLSTFIYSVKFKYQEHWNINYIGQRPMGIPHYHNHLVQSSFKQGRIWLTKLPLSTLNYTSLNKAVLSYDSLLGGIIVTHSYSVHHYKYTTWLLASSHLFKRHIIRVVELGACRYGKPKHLVRTLHLNINTMYDNSLLKLLT